jgi:hypothetical protein
MTTSLYTAGFPKVVCSTHALKNANYLQRVAPFIVPESEPPEDLTKLPPQLLDRIHIPEVQDSLGAYPRLAALLRKAPFPPIATRAIAPLFNGTIFFVRIEFMIQSQGNATIAVSNEDIATAISYATRTSRIISAYAAQYGPLSVAINTTILPFLLPWPESCSLMP